MWESSDSSTHSPKPDNTRAGGPDDSRAGGPDDSRKSDAGEETPPEEKAGTPRGGHEQSRSSSR